MAMPPNGISHDDNPSGGEPLTEDEEENMAVDTQVRTHNQVLMFRFSLTINY